MRLVVVLVSVVGAVGLSGCYGSTEPATNVGLDRATLAAHGTANAGDAHVYFQYWPTAHPDDVFTTIGKDVPAGSSGDYTEPTASSFTGLAPATEYGYHVCARDQSAPGGVCAQTRTFSTVRPAGDTVSGSYLTAFGGIGHSGSVDAHASTSGKVSGWITLPTDHNGSYPFATGQFTGFVTCIRVQGNRATVGALGNAGKPNTLVAALFEVVDTGPGPWNGSGDQIAWTEVQSSTAPNCAAGSFTDLSSPPYSELIVYDAP